MSGDECRVATVLAVLQQRAEVLSVDALVQDFSLLLPSILILIFILIIRPRDWLGCETNNISSSLALEPVHAFSTTATGRREPVPYRRKEKGGSDTSAWGLRVGSGGGSE